MRPLRIALAACMLFATPALVTEPLSPQPPQPPNVRTIPPFKRPHPAATGRNPHRPHRPNVSPVVVIDGSFVDRYLATPGPKSKRTPVPRANNGQDVFETHSTDDAK
jgi:hypothetical protein